MFSAAQRYIFKSYLYALGMGEIKNTDYTNNVKIYLTDQNFIDANSSVKFNINNFENTNLRFKDLNSISNVITKVTKTNLMLDTSITSFNDETGLPSEISYERIVSYPASGKIFSYEHCNSWLTRDLDWSITALEAPTAEKYFATEYQFASAYNKEEYQSYNLKENFVDETVACIQASGMLLDEDHGSPYAMDNGAAGLLLTYTDINHKAENEIPMAYYAFGKNMYSNNNYLSVEWHEDGVLKVE